MASLKAASDGEPSDQTTTPSREGQEIVQYFEGDLEYRLIGLVADWPAEKQEAAADALLALVDALDAEMAAEDADEDEDDETEVAER